MKRLGKLLAGIFAVGAVSLAHSPATAASFFGQLPVGSSDNFFQVSLDTSSLTININTLGTRDLTLCAFCNSSYSDNYMVRFFGQSGAVLASVNASNYFYSSLFSNSHGIGAGPVWLAVPTGTTTIEVISQLFVTGMLGLDGQPLSFGNLNIFTDGSIAAATPIPSTLPLLATALTMLGLVGWRALRSADLVSRSA